MPLDPISSAAKDIGDNVQRIFASLLRDWDSAAGHIEERIRLWQLTSTAKLNAEFPYASYEQELSNWQTRNQSPPVSSAELAAAVEDYVALCRAAKLPDNQSFWQRELAAATAPETVERKRRTDSTVSARLLRDEWQKAMDKARAEWELERIAMLRREFMEELEAFLQLLQQLHQQLEMLGLDSGLFLDLSKGNLSAKEIERFQRWAKYLASDPGVRSLCDLLGKLRQLELSERIERAQVRYTQAIELPDINSREEIIGIRLGRDIEHVLPSELALLAEPETSILFDLKYVESRLMCFDMQGIQRVQQHHQKEELRSVEEAAKQGPMVICVDTSGSMDGMPETIAKAVALFIAGKARQQKRACYLINFSTGIETLDLGDDFGMEALIKFLGMSFYGGTDAIPALGHALGVMQSETYERADLLMISDFIMASLPGQLRQQIEQQRTHGNRFYSLVVGDCYMTQRLTSLFDHEWVYDPHSSQIHELIGFEQKLSISAKNG
ncbi:VWA domain-containing protein [Pseudomonas sp. GOM6]|uniref:VWA domain-containing protein n=1 Tax=Pseudomonas sp. GOM6 TaxID=3036944 RepID=UPI00240A59A0|nr:VWA domain-containing protein [Pseudomonas sp. GOM6]MDG1582834.1 VWA domain-containing protein [Pseudomonas sp. GOM6]